MSFEEAIKQLAELIDVTEHEDIFEALKNASNDAPDSSEWKQKYLELKEKYKERFIDEITKKDKPEEEEEKKEITVEDLDFDGSTE